MREKILFTTEYGALYLSCELNGSIGGRLFHIIRHQLSAILAEASNLGEGAMRPILSYAVVLIMVFYLSPSARIINVPGDYRTIGGGIAAADHGDMVLVQPGLYFEHICFNGEGITVASMFIYTGDYSDIESTIIDGGGSGFVVEFDADWENYRDTIIGFTIQNGDLGFMCFHYTRPIISFNIIRGNSSEWAGGIYATLSSATITHNLITGNSSGDGAGILIGTFSDAEVYNNVIAGNSAGGDGGGIFVEGVTSAFIENNVIFGNTSGQYGGGIYTRSNDITIRNTIFWGDSAGVDANEIYVESGNPLIEFCDVEGGWEGWNMDEDPLFRDPQNGDFHLMWTECSDPHDSPCIDAGIEFDSIEDCDWGLGFGLTDFGAYGGWHIDLPTAVDEDDGSNIPAAIQLFQNYPNPFNAQTVMKYTLPASGEVTISVHDLLGRRISTVFDGLQVSGNHTVLWNAPDLPSGIYFARLQAGGQNATVKMVLVR
jgi:hypothetical protein